MSIPIVPAVIPADQRAVELYAAQLGFAKEFHLDVVDGIFVPTVSWPYAPAGDPRAVRHVLDPYTLEVDLMTSDPLSAAEAWIEAGADMLVFHIETIALDAFQSFVETTDISIGVSAHGGTPFEDLLQYAESADYVQLMGIFEIGAQGQPFDDTVLDRIGVINAQFPGMAVSIDGSVNADTAERLVAAGATRLITGSAVVLQDDPYAAYLALNTLING